MNYNPLYSPSEYYKQARDDQRCPWRHDLDASSSLVSFYIHEFDSRSMSLPAVCGCSPQLSQCVAETSGSRWAGKGMLAFLGTAAAVGELACKMPQRAFPSEETLCCCHRPYISASGCCFCSPSQVQMYKDTSNALHCLQFPPHLVGDGQVYLTSPCWQDSLR